MKLIKSVLIFFLMVLLNFNVVYADEEIDNTEFTVWYVSDIQGCFDGGAGTDWLGTALSDLENNNISWDIALFLGDQAEEWLGDVGEQNQLVEDELWEYLDNVTYGGRTHNRSDVYMMPGNHDSDTVKSGDRPWSFKELSNGTDSWNPWEVFEWSVEDNLTQNSWRKYPLNVELSGYDGFNNDADTDEYWYTFGIENYTFDVGNLRFITAIGSLNHPNLYSFYDVNNWIDRVVNNDSERMVIMNGHYRLNATSQSTRVYDGDGNTSGWLYADNVTQHQFACEEFMDNDNFVMWFGGHQHGIPVISYYNDDFNWNQTTVFTQTLKEYNDAFGYDTDNDHNITHINAASLGDHSSECNHPAIWSLFVTFTNNSKDVKVKARMHTAWLNDDNSWYQDSDEVNYPNEDFNTWCNFSYRYVNDTAAWGTEYTFELPMEFLLNGPVDEVASVDGDYQYVADFATSLFIISVTVVSLNYFRKFGGIL